MKKKIIGVIMYGLVLIMITPSLLATTTSEAYIPSDFTLSLDEIDLTKNYQVKKERAHAIAECARSLGLSEKDPIIVRAKEIWHKADEDFKIDRDIIATVVYNEAGYGCSDRHMELVAAVVCNRVNSDRFPDTVYDVVVAPKQYHPGYVKPDGYLGKRARESEIWSKCQEIATKALNGEIECPANVYYQANFVQGSAIYEIHKTSYSTTWFCYE
jgi:hypothetical protein